MGGELKTFQQEHGLALLGQLTAGVVHDARNLLCNMGLVVDRLAMLVPKQDEKIDKNLARLRNGLADMNVMFSSVLDIARPAEEQALELDEMVDEALRVVRPTTRGFGVRLAFESEPVAVRGCGAKLRQVLCNLVLNACQACGAGGQVKVLVERDGDVARLVVEDNGPGVVPAQRDDIFSPFVTSKSNGSGLGLWNCRQIVEEMGGRIQVGDSALGGARFEVELPAI
ncbi:MAG: sensor histidine kinase [Vulcanimicrobiota bacterium]